MPEFQLCGDALTVRHDEHEVRAIIEVLYREHSRSIFARLVGIFQEFDLAEDALQDAFSAALRQWPSDGIPRRTLPWLIQTAKFKALDSLKRRRERDLPSDELLCEGSTQPETELLGDELLRLIFTCCHPALSPEAQVALTLREVCDLTTEEIARAFLVPATTIAQRIVRAKAKFRDAKIPFEAPEAGDLESRLDAVLKVVYLVFNEAYNASSGHSVMRADLAREAIRLGQVLVKLLPTSETLGLLALMLFQDSRRAARVNASGDIVRLEDQDRSSWSARSIAEADELLSRALRTASPGPFALQAAVAGIHSAAASYSETDWHELVGLYDLLLLVQPSPIVALNRAVAVAMRDGAESGVLLVEQLLAKPELAEYHLAYVARAEMNRMLSKHEAAISDFRRALELTTQEPEQRLIKRRMEEIS